MGYSEVRCHICGVSFNTSRIRVPSESRSQAWREIRHIHSPSFVPAGSANCPRNSGCMIAHREDAMLEMEKRSWLWTWTGGIPQSNLEVSGRWQDDEFARQFSEDDDEHDEDWRETPDSTQESGFEEGLGSPHQIDRSDYEFFTPPDTCSVASDNDHDDEMSLDQDEASNKDYAWFVDSLKAPMHASLKWGGSDDTVLPLYRPIDNEDGECASIHGSETSFDENDYMPDPNDDSPGRWCWRNTAKSDHRRSGKLSYYKHVLNGNLRLDMHETAWEHLAGPLCISREGYHGDRISVAEMDGCETAQCLALKNYIEGGWQSRPDDEDFERSGSWFLTGITDHMPSRDIGPPRVFPERHGVQETHAENHRWGVYHENYSMPFHPTCLEVYKRASLRRIGEIDIESLGSWWILEAGGSFEQRMEKERDGPVSRAAHQQWQHIPGDEYLAANPCYVSGLNQLVLQSQKQNLVDLLRSRIGRLPVELRIRLLSFLEIEDIARLAIALSEIAPEAEEIIRTSLTRHRPWLWELWCDLAYSKWTGVTMKDLKARQQFFDTEQEHIAFVLDALQEEDQLCALKVAEEYWSVNTDSRGSENLSPLLFEKRPLDMMSLKFDVSRFVLHFEDAFEAGKLKGLQNRARIWENCNTIINQIEEHKAEGKILSDGTVRSGEKTYLN